MSGRGYRRALANLATFTRLLLVVPIAGAILEGRGGIALVLLAVAVASDAVDGWLARRYGTTAFGSWLDAAADRLLIAAIVGALWWTGALPTWITAVLVLREALVAAGALATAGTTKPMRPHLLGKAHTALAFALLVVALAASAGLVPDWAMHLLAVIVAVSAAISLAAYVRRLLR